MLNGLNSLIVSIESDIRIFLLSVEDTQFKITGVLNGIVPSSISFLQYGQCIFLILHLAIQVYIRAQTAIVSYQYIITYKFTCQ